MRARFLNMKKGKPDEFCRLNTLHLLDEESFFEQLVSYGEGKNLEFTERLPFTYEIIKDILAFANTEGGLIIYGIDARAHF